MTTPATWSMGAAERRAALAAFLQRQYLDDSGRLSRLAARDLVVRIVYISACFSLFSGIERLAVNQWPKD